MPSKRTFVKSDVIRRTMCSECLFNVSNASTIENFALSLLISFLNMLAAGLSDEQIINITQVSQQLLNKLKEQGEP